jgi:hypothetical protein
VSTEASILGLSTARTSEIGRIRPAHPDEGQRLREIAIASKSYWGYDPEWVTEWAALGDFSARALSEKAVYVAEADGRAVAFAVLGEQARRLGAERLEWEAEPNAVGFYERMGARRVRDSARTMWGRVIPVMRADLAALPWSTDE